MDVACMCPTSSTADGPPTSVASLLRFGVWESVPIGELSITLAF